MLLETTAAQQQLRLRRPVAPARTPAQVISKATTTNAGAGAVASKNDDVNDTASTSSLAACAFSCSSSSASHAPPMSPVPAATAALSSFLQRCFLCHRELADGRDIYIYRGDRAFCSEECRCRHILVEDDDDDDCARVVAAADRSRRRRRQAVAGGCGF